MLKKSKSQKVSKQVLVAKPALKLVHTPKSFLPYTVAANWKMHLGDQQGLRLAVQVSIDYKKLAMPPHLVLCPPFTVLSQVFSLVKDSAIKVGAQDVSWATEGANTGEVSAQMLVAAGSSYVIIGHSERRQHLGETDQTVQRKLFRAVEAGLTPILCVGETWEERSDFKSEIVVMKQLQTALDGLTLPVGRQLYIAYEPVWAIGSGNPVMPDEAAHMSQFIHHLVVDGESFNFRCRQPDQQIKVLYGGSVEADNVQTFYMPGVIDGVLVGGASLEEQKFMSLLRALKTGK